MPTTRTLKLVPLALALAAALTACGATELQLSASPASVAAGGTSFTTITAIAYSVGEPVAAGIKVSFSTDAGSFSGTSEVTYIDSSTDATGTARVKLYSARSAGQATVTATFYDEQGNYAESSITVQFTAPLPVDGKFRMTCDAVNVGALRTPVPDIKVTCTLTAQTRGGDTIPVTAIQPSFMTEAGSLTPTDDYYSGKRVFVYSPKGGGSVPVNVPPDQNLREPSYSDNNGRVRNPRDGLVTLVAVVEGEEAFTDVNGNGERDESEPFSDAAEPFLDVDDDDQHDPAEKYVDVNGNGRWDKANGKWDARTKIMAIYKILWTGALNSYSKTSRIESSSTTNAIPKGGQLELTAYLLDVNMNPVAAFGKNSDYMEWVLGGSSEAALKGDQQPPLKNLLGFSFDDAASSERKRWKISPNSFVPPSRKITVEDGYPTYDSKPLSWSVTVTAHVTPGPQESGYWLTQVTESIAGKAEGTCR